MDGQWQQYPDATLRETYPPAQTRGGNMNAQATETVISTVSSALARTQQQEAAFRARQYARRLQTRGAAAMRPPEESLPTPEFELPDDPALDEFKAAGWL